MYQIRFADGYISKFENEDLSEVIRVGKIISLVAHLISKHENKKPFHILKDKQVVGHWDMKEGFIPGPP